MDARTDAGLTTGDRACSPLSRDRIAGSQDRPQRCADPPTKRLCPPGEISTVSPLSCQAVRHIQPRDRQFAVRRSIGSPHQAWRATCDLRQPRFRRGERQFITPFPCRPQREFSRGLYQRQNCHRDYAVKSVLNLSPFFFTSFPFRPWIAAQHWAPDRSRSRHFALDILC